MKIFNNFEKILINKYSYNLNDTGSPAIQIIMFSVKIKKVLNHIKNNKKDFNSRKCLFILISKRNKLYKYLKSRNFKIYNELITDLKIL